MKKTKNITESQNINSIDIYADSLNEKKDKLVKCFSEFIFGFNLKSYTFDKYKTINKEKLNIKFSLLIPLAAASTAVCNTT